MRACGQLGGSDWYEYPAPADSKGGKFYYYNVKTQVTQWTKPDEFKSEEVSNRFASSLRFCVTHRRRLHACVCRRKALRRLRFGKR
jgi:hypothetical protein